MADTRSRNHADNAAHNPALTYVLDGYPSTEGDETARSDMPNKCRADLRPDTLHAIPLNTLLDIVNEPKKLEQVLSI